MLRLATFYLRDAGDDIWGIRINRFILRALGVRAGLVPAATERNFQTVIGAKLNHIPTVGILHGFASRHYNMYDFMHTYSGEKTFSVDRYGLWSEWWKEYYQRYSKAYRGEQLYVSGPMRPSVPQSKNGGEETREAGRPLRVLLVSEIVAVPSEVLPYLEALTTSRDIAVSIKFRATGDRFEEWLTVHRPDILRMLPPGNILKGRMDEAIQEADVVVGSQSTGVIEATLQDKPFVLFNTEKWGDYFDMRSFGGEYKFFAENPGEFIGIVRDTKDVPVPVLRSIRQKFFGDAEKNGSAWAVDQLEEYLRN